jgi:Tfp pilus assembly protein PilP
MGLKIRDKRRRQDTFPAEEMAFLDGALAGYIMTNERVSGIAYAKEGFYRRGSYAGYVYKRIESYSDSKIAVFAVGRNAEKSDNCRQVLQKIRDGRGYRNTYRDLMENRWQPKKFKK